MDLGRAIISIADYVRLIQSLKHATELFYASVTLIFTAKIMTMMMRPKLNLAG